MKIITNPNDFRSKVKDNLNNIIQNENMALNLEKGIYNYTIKEADMKNIVKKWDNNYFVQIYTDRLRSIYFNLKNQSVLDMIKSKKIKAHVLAFMSHQEMNPDLWHELIEAKKIRDKNKYESKMEAMTDTYKCRRCQGRRCTYYQLQTRSSDEPMTTFVTCLDCGSRWKC